MRKQLDFFRQNMKGIFWGVLLCQLIAMLFMSQQAGISSDEYRHINQAEKVYNYYKTDGEDRSALENTGIDPMQFNGQAFDNLMYLFTEKFEVENYMEMRHLFNALIAWLILLITGLIAKEFWGWKGALLAIFILFISPRFLGHGLNNNKDIPFAFGFMLSLYGTFRFIKDLPRFRLSSIAWLLVGIASAISIRVAGILSIGFFGLFVIFHYLMLQPINKPFGKEKMRLCKHLLWCVPAIAVAGYSIGILFWPFMMEAPIENLKKVLDATASHPVSLNQLFEGKLVKSNTLPSYYSLKWALITYPTIVLLGIVLALAFVRRAKKENAMTYFYLIFAFVFVLAWMSLRQSNFYGGIRHLLFIYPVAVLVAVVGIQLLSDFLSEKGNKYLQYIPWAIVMLLSVHPIAHLFRNYPYSYVYFNELSGGMDQVKDRYETDYFQHSIRRATEWLVENELKGTDKKVIVASNDNKNCNYWTRDVEQVKKVIYTRYYDKYAKDWDYAVYYCGYIQPEQIRNGQWPPVGTIHTETVDGFPIAVVMRRESKEDLEGYKVFNKNLVQAKNHFEKFLETNEPNEQITKLLAKAYFALGDINKAEEYASRSLELCPGIMEVIWVKTLILIAKGKYKEAVVVCDDILKEYPNFYQAYYQKGFCMQRLGNPNEALKLYSQAIDLNADFYEAYMQVGDIYLNFERYDEAMKIYSKVNQFKKNDLKVAMQIAKVYYFQKNSKELQVIMNIVPAALYTTELYANIKARMLIDSGDLASAMILLDQVKKGNSAEFLLVQGYLARAKGQEDLARDFFNKALVKDPYFNEVKEALK